MVKTGHLKTSRVRFTFILSFSITSQLGIKIKNWQRIMYLFLDFIVKL